MGRKDEDALNRRAAGKDLCLLSRPAIEGFLIFLAARRLRAS